MALFVRYQPIVLGSGGGGGGGSGVAVVGTFDSQTKSANGAVISGSSIYFQSADASFPGMVTTGVQTFAGNKTFTGTIGASNLSGTNTGDVTLGTANGLSLSSQVLSLALSSTSTTGALSSTDWNTFNNKQAALTFGNLTDVGTDGITITGGTGAVIGSGASISQHVADTTHNGYLSSTDWNTFNSKQSTVSFTAFGSSPNANGAVISSGAITLEPADATHPGGIALGAQTMGSGTKTFDNIIDSGLTASQAVVTNGSKQLASLAYTAANTGSTIVSRDLNGNSTFVNVVTTVTTVVSGGQTITMNAGSAGIQKITGTSTVTFTLPIATNMYSGQSYDFNNNSTGAVTINDASNALVQTVPAGGYTRVINTDNSTTAGVWDVHNFLASGSTSGSAATTLPAGSSLGILGSSSGTASIKAPSSFTSYNFNLPATAGSAGDYLTSGGGSSSAMTWTTPLAPTIQTFTSGSGTYMTPTSPRSPLYIRVRMVGGGGGGSGSSSFAAGDGGTGGNGGDTTFGTSLLVAHGGIGGAGAVGNGGAGGTASLGTGPTGTALTGGTGTGAQASNTANNFLNGGAGAASPFGGAGGGAFGQSSGNAGLDAAANSGSGGGGAGGKSGAVSGSGGGAGGFVDAIIASPSATYSYAVGAGGSAGAAGTSGEIGGVGGSGYIEVTAYYQ